VLQVTGVTFLNVTPVTVTPVRSAHFIMVKYLSYQVFAQLFRILVTNHYITHIHQQPLSSDW